MPMGRGAMVGGGGWFDLARLVRESRRLVEFGLWPWWTRFFVCGCITYCES